MTIGEFRELTKDAADDVEVRVELQRGVIAAEAQIIDARYGADVPEQIIVIGPKDQS